MSSLKAACLAGASALCIAWLAPAVVEMPSAAASGTAKAANWGRLVSSAKAKGHVSVIVEFAVAGAAKEAVENAIIAEHFGSSANPRPGAGFTRALQRFGVSPMFAVNVSPAELEALAADPRVIRIHANELNRTM